MSTPFSKSKLKAARDAIAKKDWQSASQNAQQVLDYEPDNYNARVFLALALLELGQTDQSESEYRKAIESNSTQPLAWQGLAKFYERVEKWDKYAQTLLALADIFNKSRDATKCAENVQKYIDLRRERGNRTDVIEALNLLLPNSPYYSLLSSLPEPDPTNPTATTTFQIQTAVYNSLPIYQELVSLAERDESERITKEVEKRRMRLNAAGPEQLKKEVGKEVWADSKLPALYKEVINHPATSDELRRDTESKLLRHKQTHLYALSNSGPDTTLKKELSKEVEELISGVVLLKIPDELAWQLYLDGVDIDAIDSYDFSVISHYVRLFPETPLGKVLQLYSSYMGYDAQSEDEDEPQPQRKSPEEQEALVNAILEAYTKASDFILPNRIAADLYLADSDYGNAIKVCEHGLAIARTVEVNRGKLLAKCKKAFNAILATSLVHYFPPKHHPRGSGIIAEILAVEPNNVPCLMARAYTFRIASQWQEASDGFARIIKLVPDTSSDGLQALEEYHWCQLQLSHFDSALEGLELVFKQLEKDGDKARCLWRIGRCYWEMGGDDNQEEAFKKFIACLKCDSTYAPAFTSLGIYYSEHLTPPDPTRASKCFQKAFELDAREVEAAKRLADGFAEEREWDLVEVIARRTIEGEGGLEGGLKSDKVVPGRYTPTNAWAWKAVGVVELIQKNYPAAIQSFQVALRALPDDDVAWLRLGEAYSKAGRHVAAIKALKKAQELQPGNWLCDYSLGEVQRQLGQFSEAIESFQAILKIQPTELGALQALSQTYLDMGLFDSSQNFVARAEESYAHCIHYALSAITEHTGFRGMAWKNIGDGLFHLSCLSSFNDLDNVNSIFGQVHALLTSPHGERIGQLAPQFSYPSRPDASSNPIAALELAILAYDHRISLGFTEVSVSASAWYDLGTSIHAWANRTKAADETISQKAISYVKRALQEDPGNDNYWNTYGNLHFTSNPKLAQHAYIRAAEIDNKNVATWTNLGLLYLHHEDIELANEAFYRAQTLDPDYTPAWVGQALVATAHKHDADARNLIEHAITLSKIIPEADIEYATRTFNRLKECPVEDEGTISSLLTCFFTLNRYCLHRSSDADGLHLLGLVCERMDLLDVAAQSFSRSIELLEAVYEETEDPNIERKFAIANVNLARVKLALEDHQGALEGFESAIGLLDGFSEEEGESLTVNVPLLLRARAMMGAGQAHFKLGNLQEAIERFEGALELSAEDAALRGQITVLLSQTLWAIGSEDFKESAKAQLLDCVTNDPENLAAITALAGMGIVSQDDSLVDAALSEILSLPLEQRRALDPAGDVDYLLVQHHLAQGETKKALVVAQAAVHVEPDRRQHRSKLAKLALQLSKPETARAVLSSVDVFEDGEGVLLKAVADTLCGDQDALRLVQKLVFSRPGEEKNWQVLEFIRGIVTEAE